MNILHATDFHTRMNLGISVAVNGLISRTLPEVAPRGSVHLLSVGPTDTPLHRQMRHISTAASSGLTSIWRYAPHYSEMCDDIIRTESISLIHIHGAWMYPQFAAARAARRHGVPSVLTNHGLLQWALRQPNRIGALKKRFYLALMRDRLFQSVSVLHAITASDRDCLHRLFPGKRIETIPNFIDVDEVDRIGQQTPERQDEPYVLFLGQLHPAKGVDVLIDAFNVAEVPDELRLIIAGPLVDAAYAAQLRRTIAASPRGNRIELRGPVWEASEKYALMRKAWITAVPSRSDVISFVNLESSACSTPTITTSGAGLTDWTEGGGLTIEPAVVPLAAALGEAFRWSNDERIERGRASRRLIEKSYSAVAVIPRWMSLYRSLH